MGQAERERQRETDRQTYRDRQTDRQIEAERQTDRQIDRVRQTDRLQTSELYYTRTEILGSSLFLQSVLANLHGQHT